MLQLRSATTTTAFGWEGLSVVPWKLDEPQPIVVEIAEGGLADPVLEVGCGLGDNAALLARRGHRVTAVDASSAAIDQGRATAAALGLEIDFRVADATTLDGVAPGFRTVLDSALLHCLDRPQRRA